MVAKAMHLQRAAPPKISVPFSQLVTSFVREVSWHTHCGGHCRPVNSMAVAMTEGVAIDRCARVAHTQGSGTSAYSAGLGGRDYQGMDPGMSLSSPLPLPFLSPS